MIKFLKKIIYYLLGATVICSFVWTVYDVVGTVFGFDHSWIPLFIFIGSLIISLLWVYISALIYTKKFLIHESRKKEGEKVKPISSGLSEKMLKDAEKLNHKSAYHK